MLRIAVPNKGSLAESSIAILKEAGYRQRTDSRDLVLADPDNGVEFYYLRPRDIAVYVGSGELEAGITGRDLLIDSAAEADEILSLDFGSSTFRFAGPADKEWSVQDIAGNDATSAINISVSNNSTFRSPPNQPQAPSATGGDGRATVTVVAPTTGGVVQPHARGAPHVPRGPAPGGVLARGAQLPHVLRANVAR